jgi:hypothetical protein
MEFHFLEQRVYVVCNLTGMSLYYVYTIQTAFQSSFYIPFLQNSFQQRPKYLICLYIPIAFCYSNIYTKVSLYHRFDKNEMFLKVMVSSYECLSFAANQFFKFYIAQKIILI